MVLDGTFNILLEEGIMSTIYAIRNLPIDLSILQQSLAWLAFKCAKSNYYVTLCKRTGVMRLTPVVKTFLLPHLVPDLEAFRILYCFAYTLSRPSISSLPLIQPKGLHVTNEPSHYQLNTQLPSSARVPFPPNTAYLHNLLPIRSAR